MNSGQMQVGRRIIVGGCVCLAAVIAVAFDAPTADAQNRRRNWRDISWDVKPQAVVQYNVTIEADAKPDLGAPLGPAEQYAKRSDAAPWHYTGFELSPTGPTLEPYTIDDLLDQLAMWVPNRRFQRRGSWRHEADYYLQSPRSHVRVTGQLAAADGNADDEDTPLELIGTFQLANFTPDSMDVKKWPSGTTDLREGIVRTRMIFDRRRGMVQEVTVEARLWYDYTPPAADPANPGAAPAVATNPFSRWYRAKFTLGGIIDSSDKAALDRYVAAAIGRGVAHLRQLQAADGSWSYGAPHTPGATALCLLALLASDVPKDDPAVVKGFDYLAANPPTRVYDAGLVCMAVEARGIPEEEWRLAHQNRMPAVFRRDLSDQDRATLAQAARFILHNNTPDIDPTTKQRMWSYPTPESSTRYDHSVTQYALLGLFAAMRCGIEVPPSYFRATAEHFIIAQEPDGPEVYRLMPPANERTTAQRTSRTPDRSRGFGYTAIGASAQHVTTGSRIHFRTRAYSSMTTAGIACLIIARAGLERSRQLTPQLRTQIDKGVRDGLAWLQHNYRVTGQSGAQTRRSWFYYHLYGIERAAILAGTEWIGEHRWYNEGAALLCLEQGTNGAWGGNTDTAFALLFLKRGTLPVTSGVYTE